MVPQNVAKWLMDRFECVNHHHNHINRRQLLTDSIFVTGVFTGHHLHPSGLQLDGFLDCRQEDTTGLLCFIWQKMSYVRPVGATCLGTVHWILSYDGCCLRWSAAEASSCLKSLVRVKLSQSAWEGESTGRIGRSENTVGLSILGETLSLVHTSGHHTLAKQPRQLKTAPNEVKPGVQLSAEVKVGFWCDFTPSSQAQKGWRCFEEVRVQKPFVPLAWKVWTWELNEW